MIEKLKKIIKSRKGQIGPMSLEDIPSLTIMLMMTMIFIVLIFKVVGGYLETNRAVDMYMSANEILNIIESKSTLVSEGRVGYLDTSNSFNLNDYKLVEYECRVEIKNANDNSPLYSRGPPKPDETTISASSPVAVIHNGGVYVGVLTVIVWQD